MAFSKAGNEVETVLAVPLRRDGAAIGAITATRDGATPFANKQIALLETFADQAVIAIENARLLDELQTRQMELQESLEFQTATSDVLSVISRSPDKIQPVLDTIAATAGALCDADYTGFFMQDADDFRIVANDKVTGEFLAYVRANPVPKSRGSVVGRAALEKRTVHIADVLADTEYALSENQRMGGSRTHLAVPLIKEEAVVGVISLIRRSVMPFSERQINLIETFANQAVIAVNNVGLFEEVQSRSTELQQSLEFQTATSKVLSVISASPHDATPAFQAIVETARQLCKADRAAIWRAGESGFTMVTRAGDAAPEQFERELSTQVLPFDRRSVCGRVGLEQRTIHIIDLQSDPEYSVLRGHDGENRRSMLGVPLLQKDKVIGVIVLIRTRQAAFSDTHIRLVETFANQAVIAINNVGLFEEVQARSKALARSVEELRSLGDVGRTVSSTLDMSKVLQTVLENACRMAFAGGGTIYVYDLATQQFHLEAGYNMSEEHTARVRSQPMRLGDAFVGECAERREAVQIEDLSAVEGSRSPLIDILLRGGVRAILAVPLLHQGTVIGALVVRRSYPGAFSNETVRLLETFAAQSAIAVNNARLFKEVDEKGEQLRLASQHKSQFLANMSHELRTPLNAILGYTELMQDGIYGDLPEKASGVLGRVQSNGRHLLGLINQVLDLSKIEAGQLKLNLGEYSIGSVIETVIAATESLATEKKLVLRTEVAKDIPRGIGDEQRIAQVLLNLVGNAIKFTEAGGVRIQAGAFAGRYQVAVVDTGLGIPKGQLARIFEEFHQVDSSNTKTKGGTGLGLAIARRIVELHGGRIWVESSPGLGSTFRFEVPIQAEQAVLAGVAKGTA